MSDSGTTGKPRPHYHGHRERLRRRFLDAGPEALADYELMELVLFLARARGDVKPLAKRLIGEFGGFAAALGADSARLRQVDGVAEATVTALKTVRAAAVRLLREEAAERPVLSSWDRLINYCRAAMAEEKVEQFRLLFLDARLRLVRDEVHQWGTIDHTPVYPREVVRRALELGASSLIMVHNHPSGDPTPSKADIEMTREVVKAAEALGIAVHDHVVIGKNGHSSFKAMGLL